MIARKQSPVAYAPGSLGRRGFTLVELLVVMALIAVLAALTIAFFPNAASSARESRAAVQVQSWLNIAKQRALRDQAPRGLRLWIVPPPGAIVTGIVPILNAVTDCQYLEQPEDYSVGAIQSGLPNPALAMQAAYVAQGYSASNCIFVNGADLVNSYSAVTVIPNMPIAGFPGDPNIKYWSVQPGDYIEINGTGLLYQIVQVGVPSDPVGNPGAGNPAFVKINPPLPFPINTPTASYRITRAPRPVGEETLKMPEGTIIDLQTNINSNTLPLPDPNSGTGYFYILFAPTGQVISRGITWDKIHLWVRAPSNDPALTLDPFRGDPTLLSIFVRTGFVGSFKPNPNIPPGPYDLVK